MASARNVGHYLEAERYTTRWNARFVPLGGEIVTPRPGQQGVGMSFLARADRRAVGYGVAGSLVLSFAGAFWALPHIEDELDEESLGVASYVASPGFVVEWNGRDGYLTVPAGTRRVDAERVAADLADIQGTRDVEVRYRDGVSSDAPAPDVDASVPEEASEQAASAARTPAEFGLLWDPLGRTATGVVPTDEAARLADIFSADGWSDRADRSLSPGTTTALTSVIAPLVGNDISSGSLSVADDQISVSGVVADEETRGRLTDLLEAESTVSTVELTVASSVPEPSTEEQAADDTATAEQDPPNETISPEEIQAELDALALVGIQFETNTSLLTADAESVLDDIAELLLANPTIDVVIGGHTDRRGSAVDNQALSEARASAVSAALESRGIDGERLEAVGFGETEPIASNDTVEGQRQNRRVEIKIKETD